MIYLVSNDLDVSKEPDMENISLTAALSMIASWPVVQYDSETTGLDEHICFLTSLQFGYKNFSDGSHNEIVVDCRSCAPELFKDAIEHSYLIGHNLKFDLKFLYNHGIHPLQVYDTMICEQTLYLGYKPGRVSMRLGDVLYRYTGEELDKSYQKQIASKGLTLEGIRYAANDVVHLQDIRKAQVLVARSRNCLNAFTVENRFVPAIAYLEWCGVHLDERKWRAKMEKDQLRFTRELERLNDYVVTSTKLNTRFVSTYTQLDLFDKTVTDFTPSCTVDWASSRQVVPVFQALGFNTEVMDKKTRKIRNSVEYDVISTQKGIADDFVQLYYAYKEVEKKTSTYGQNFLNLINPNTGRLHTEFKQLGTVTGRMSSGGGSEDSGDSSGKGKMNKELAALKGLPEDEVRYVNMQNLPAKGEEGRITRECFTATGGNVFISCDYSAEESRVQGVVWNERKLIESFEQGIDTHNVYAKLCFPEELKDVDVRDVKKVRPDLRSKAKQAEFAIGYGSDGSSISKKIGLPKEKAREMVRGILAGMTGMAAFKKKTVRFLKNHGYIVLHEATGHRVYWPEWGTWKAVEDTFDRDFWNNYVVFHRGTNDEVVKKVRRQRELSHDWFEKNVLNYPIQGGSAIVLKQAAADLYEWVVRNGYFGKILFCVFVHDEICVECPEEMKDSFTKTMTSIMEKAAGKYYKRLKIPAEASVAPYWVH